MENVLESAISPQQIFIVLIVVVLLFGAKKIPDLMKGVGKGIKGFKDEMNPENDSKDKPKIEDDKA
mgnify:CR=1 FL=1|tara:strand:- start:919 stop:1116 length:198 start_codon:yes stop_codon:yes gene_type:complete